MPASWTGTAIRNGGAPSTGIPCSGRQLRTAAVGPDRPGRGPVLYR